MKHPGVVCLLAGLGLSMVGCAHSTKYAATEPAMGGRAATRFEVAVLEFHFRPESLNVFTGDTVTWVNHGRVPHTTTSGVNGKPDGLWASKHLSRGASFSHVFTEPGTFRYYCTPHHALGMKGVIVVTSR